LWFFILQYTILKLKPKVTDKSNYILRPTKTCQQRNAAHA